MTDFEYPKNLNDISNFVLKIKDILKDNLIACVLYGSAITEDYLQGWSDIDIVCIVRNKVETALQQYCLTLEEYYQQCKQQTIFAYIINQGKIIYKTDIEFKLCEPKIPHKAYRYILLNYMFGAMKLRLNYSNLRLKVRQLYHAVRHFLRYFGLKYNMFPITIEEVLQVAELYDKFNKPRLTGLIRKVLSFRAQPITLKIYRRLERKVLQFFMRTCFGKEEKKCEKENNKKE